MKKAYAVFIATLASFFCFKVIVAIVAIFGALVLGAIDIDVSESDRALRNLEAFSNILAFAVAIISGYKLYRFMTRVVEKQSEAINQKIEGEKVGEQ